MLQENLPAANHVCEVCRTKYYACNKCIELKHKGIYGWKLTCCTRSCFQLKMFYEMYTAGNFDKQQALDFVSTLTLPVQNDALDEKYVLFLNEIQTIGEN